MKKIKFLIIGSGPGGTTVLKTLLDNNIEDVGIIEEGDDSKDTVMGSFDDLINKYRYGGADIIFSKPNIAYAEGKTLGGGSEINSGLYHRIPEQELSDWRSKYSIDDLEKSNLEEHYQFVEDWLNIKKSNQEPSLISKKLILGSEMKGLKSNEIPRWKSLKKTFYYQESDLNIIKKTKVLNFKKINNKFIVNCLDLENKETYKIEATYLILSCGTFETHKLLTFSGYELRENTFSIHPHIKVGAKFTDSIEDGEKVSPYQTKVPDYETSYGTSINSKQWKALFLSENIRNFKNEISEIDKIGIFYSAIKPVGEGKINYSKFLKTNILSFKFSKEDINNLIYGVNLLIKLLNIAGAKSTYLPLNNNETLNHGNFKNLSIHTVHTFSSMKLGNNNSNCNSFGVLHGEPNILISDASILPGPPGVNPQGPLMALCRRNALNFIERENL